MTLDEIREAMSCYAGLIKNGKPACFDCNKKDFCDDITRVILRHKDPEKKKPAAEKQQDLIKPESRYHNLR